MLKKIIFEKIYILFTIISISGYSIINMLANEKDSIYSTEDPLLLKLLVGILFMMSLTYILYNYNLISSNKITRLLLFLSTYMAIWRIIGLPITAGLFAYLYQPMRDMLIINMFLFTCIISTKSEELTKFFSTSMMLALFITSFFYYKNWTFANEVDEAHLGTSYYVLFLLPMVLFAAHRWIKLLAIVITAVVVFSSFKRGGSIALVGATIVYLFVKEILLEHKFTKLIWFITIIFLLMLLLIYIDNAMGNIISERIMNITEDGGSGRDEVWATTWKMIKRSDFGHLILGHGYDAVSKNSLLELSAHNDFLEVLYNYGIISLIPYLLIHIHLIKQICKSIKDQDKRAPIMSFTYVIFIVLSMISHVIVYPWAVLIAMTWGLFNNPKFNSIQHVK